MLTWLSAILPSTAGSVVQVVQTTGGSTSSAGTTMTHHQLTCELPRVIIREWRYGPRYALTMAIGQRASILQCLDRPIENALGLVKIGGKIGEGIIGFWPPTNWTLVFQLPHDCSVSSNSIRNCDRRSDNRQTPAIL